MLETLLLSAILGQTSPYSPHEEPPMAYFDVVPQQDVTGRFDMGVIAYHLEGVDRVEYTIHREGFEGDFNRDGTVSAEDLSILFSKWDSRFGGQALAKLLGAWGTSTPIPDETVVRYEDAGGNGSHQRYNPRTGQDEYWFELETRLHPDTKIWVTAEIFPVDGPSLVLDKSHQLNVDGDARPFHNGVNLFSNNYGQWKVMERYVSPSGSDETGDGTQENPYKGIYRAIRHDIPMPYGEVGGTVVYLMEGDHTIDSSGGWPLGASRQSDGRFVTITPAPDLDPELCKIVAGDDYLMYGGYVHLKNVVVESSQENLLSHSSNGSRWYDNCSLRGIESEWWNGEYKKLTQTHGLQYYTDCEQVYAAEGYSGIMNRNVHYDYVQCDVIEAHWMQLGLNLLITHHNENHVEHGTACHSDYMQYNGISYVHKNVIFRDIFANHSCQEQGCHMVPGESDGGAVNDVAWINIELSNTGGLDMENCDISALVWRWGGPTRNFLMRDCILNDKLNERSHTMWAFDRYNEDGSQNTEGPWCMLRYGDDAGAVHRYHNIKVEDCWGNWEKTKPFFPMPDSGEPWVFYGPDEMAWDSDIQDGVQENPFGPDDPWFSPITGVYYTQTE